MKRKPVMVLTLLLVVSLSSSLFTGCTKSGEKEVKSWEKEVQLSDLSFEAGVGLNHVNGHINNLTDKYYDVTIRISAKSGSIDKTITTYVKLRPKELADFQALSSYGDDYQFSVKDVWLEELEIPELKDSGELTKEEVEYYFPKIYDDNSLLTTFVKNDFDLGFEVDPSVRVHILHVPNMRCVWLWHQPDT